MRAAMASQAWWKTFTALAVIAFLAGTTAYFLTGDLALFTAGFWPTILFGSCALVARRLALEAVRPTPLTWGTIALLAGTGFFVVGSIALVVLTRDPMLLGLGVFFGAPLAIFAFVLHLRARSIHRGAE